MDVIVDANVLLDILTADPQWLQWSSTSLRRAQATGQLLVNPIICAEIAPAFVFDWPRLDAWLSQAGMLKAPLSLLQRIVRIGTAEGRVTSLCLTFSSGLTLKSWAFAC